MLVSSLVLALGLGAEPAQIRSGYLTAGIQSEIALVSAQPMLIGTAQHVPGWRSRFFRPSEFASKGNGRVRIEARLLSALDRVRADVGHPIRIVSAYRDPRHNRSVGGVRDSQHVRGTAVDLDLRGLGAQARYRLMWYLIRHGFTSFGSYAAKPNLLHADMRPRAVIWHHGRGAHPAWFRRALIDTRWQRGSGGYWTRHR
ncbi:MAG: D-Ala-D-Ala carboxypeptidase family metallohydrolase [Pseudomonadota bacterium]